MTTSLAALENYDRLSKQMTAAVDGYGVESGLVSLAAASGVFENNRRMRELVDRPTRMLADSLVTASQPLLVPMSNRLVDVVRPLAGRQNELMAEMALRALPEGYLNMVRGLEDAQLARIRALSRLALAGPAQGMLDQFGLDRLTQTTGIEGLALVVNAAVAAAAAAEDVPAEDGIEVPEWLAEFAARVHALSASEQRALVFNLLGIALLIASTAVTWGTSGGAAAWLQTGGLVVAVAGLANRISALYEDDEDSGDDDA